jgi:hypothetical protein
MRILPYLYFTVCVNNKRKYFLNYNKANNYLNKNISAPRLVFNGVGLFGKVCFFIKCHTPKFKRNDIKEEIKKCNEYFIEARK